MFSKADCMYPVVLVIAVASIFVLRLVNAYKAISWAQIHSKVLSFIIAVCVAFLSMVGIGEIYAAARSENEDGNLSGKLDSVLFLCSLLFVLVLLSIAGKRIKELKGMLYRKHRESSGQQSSQHNFTPLTEYSKSKEKTDHRNYLEYWTRLAEKTVKNDYIKLLPGNNTSSNLKDIDGSGSDSEEGRSFRRGPNIKEL